MRAAGDRVLALAQTQRQLNCAELLGNLVQASIDQQVDLEIAAASAASGSRPFIISACFGIRITCAELLNQPCCM